MRPTDVPASELARLLGVPIDCSVELGRHKVSLREALELRTGSYVPANRLADEPVEVHLGGRLAAYGTLVLIDEEIGVRITELV